MDALISVIVPVYNGERFINASLQSALAQSHSNLEILVADDGSTDKTVEVVSRAAQSDSRIRLLRGTHEGLPGRVRNRALGEARGEYIAFLDADDLWSKEKIEAQLREVKKRKNVALCYTAVKEFDDKDGDPVSLTPLPLSRATGPGASEALLGEEGFRRLLLQRTFLLPSSVLLPRSLLEEIGPFNASPHLRCAEDIDLILRAYLAGVVVFVPQVHVFYRRHEGNISQSIKWPGIFEMYRLTEERGHIPKSLHRTVWSLAWTVRGEETLREGGAGWRSAMARAWSRDPFNLRRLPALLSCIFPRFLAARFYFSLRSLGGK